MDPTIIENAQRLIEASRTHENAPSLDKWAAAVTIAVSALDRGVVRVAEPSADGWKVNEWLKIAIMSYMSCRDSTIIGGGPQFGIDQRATWFDRVPLKTINWDKKRFQEADFRCVPGSVIRRGAFIGKRAVIMPSFINIGAHVGDRTMVDTWATIGSCAQIGKECHISGGAGIGGVLEPIQATPVIIEDNCFIGARSEVVEGVIVGRGSVLSMGVFLSASTKIIERSTGKIHQGYVPPYSVVVPGTVADSNGLSMYCAIIVKTVDERTRSKTSINALLRD